jgi:hypothetical protein
MREKREGQRLRPAVILDPTLEGGGIRFCPECGNALQMVHRSLGDRLVSVLRPMRRWHCTDCEWTGLLHSPMEARERYERIRHWALLGWVTALLLTVLGLGLWFLNSVLD